MILTGPAVRDAVAAGTITIDPFDPALLNPNSYNYHLGRTLKTLVSSPVNPRHEAETKTIEIGPAGYVLQPNTLYLGATVERIGSAQYVTSLIGRSSIGRLGNFLQLSADLGQLGAIHQWTLEIVVVQPLRVYAGMRIGQVSFWQPQGATMPYGGYYGTLSEPSPCSPRAAAGTRVREVAA